MVPTETAKIPTPLSRATRERLTQYGQAEFVEMRVCQKCGKHTSEIPATMRHPLQQEIIKTRQRLDLKPDSEFLQQHYAQLTSRQHFTTRCCAAEYAKKQVDQHDALWQRWCGRYSDPHPPVMQLRQEYGPEQDMRDDDFILMWFYFGLPDGQVGNLVKIFREEEAKQAVTLAATAPGATAGGQAAPKFAGPRLVSGPLSVGIKNLNRAQTLTGEDAPRLRALISMAFSGIGFDPQARPVTETVAAIGRYATALERSGFAAVLAAQVFERPWPEIKPLLQEAAQEAQRVGAV